MGYDIDDILSEVKKRREENEAKIKSGESILDFAKIDDVKPEPVVEEIEPQPEMELVEEDNNMVDINNIEDAPVEEIPEEEHSITEEEPEIQEEVSEDEVSLDDLAKTVEDSSLELAEEYPEEEPKKRKKIDSADIEARKKKNKKILISVICVMLALIIAATGGTYAYMNNLFDKITSNTSEKTKEAEWKGMETLVESFQPIYEADASEVSSLQDMIKQWYQNGLPCSSTHVLNVLLIGEDTRGSDIKDDGTRADSAIICSINIDTKKITLTSILRDTYAYWENEKGDEETGHFNKINGAMSIGDVDTYIEAVESLYKIDIDNHVIVNFDSFKSIVDIVGGVNIEMTAKEINEINSHPKRYGHVTIDKTFEGDKGTLKLNGKQALAYCRIRKIDSDNMRANRQKICLNKIFQKVKGSNSVQLLKILNAIVPYIKTDMSKNELTKITKYALKQGWTNFKVENYNIPDSRINEKGAGGIYYGSWCWKSDFPQDAYDLQMRIYGKSSITLARTRVDVLNCELNGFYNEGSNPVTATLTNYHYGEVTTVKETTTEKSEEE